MNALFNEVRNRQLATQLRASLDEQYTAKPLQRIGTVLSSSQILVANQRYPLSGAAGAAVGSQLEVHNIQRPAAAIYAPTTGGGTTIIGGGSTVTTGDVVDEVIAVTPGVDLRRTTSFSAEFSGGVLDAGDSGANIGTMTGQHDNTNHFNFYDWTTGASEPQDYDVIIQYRLPREFAAFDLLGADAPSVSMRSRIVGSSEDTFVELVEFLDSSGTNAITPAEVQNSSWDTDAYAITDGTFVANDVVTLRIKLSADTGEQAQVSEVWFYWLAAQSGEYEV